MKKTLVALMGVAALGTTLVACSSNETTTAKEPFTLNGAGATFPAGLYNAWFQSFAQETGNQVNYQAVGSGAGVSVSSKQRLLTLVLLMVL